MKAGISSQLNKNDAALASAAFSTDELLSALMENGIVDADGVRSVIMKKKEKIVLNNHTHLIWQGKDGRWKTYIEDEEKGRRQISRSSREDLTEYLYQNEIIPSVVIS